MAFSYHAQEEEEHSDPESLSPGCPLDCHCDKCQEQGYTRTLLIDDEETILYGGPVMVR